MSQSHCRRGSGPRGPVILIGLFQYAINIGLVLWALRGGATGPQANRYLRIEKELGRRAQFWGKRGLKGTK